MKTFLSIGSGPGMGQATAERFAREGFRVILTSRDVAKLAVRVASLRAQGYAAETKPVDAGRLDSVASVVRESAVEFGAIDVLHFNSASMHPTTIESQSAESFVSDLTINIGAAFVATQEAAKGMLKRGSGTILLTGGALALTPHPDYLSLGIGKAAVRNLVYGLFDNFKERGVHIASVTVGTLVTAGSRETHEIAEAFWRLYDAPRESWLAEVRYPA
jgi:short-subunit dehydrogenase